MLLIRTVDLTFADLKDDGIFVGSINTGPDIRENEQGGLTYLHQSVFPEEFWKKYILDSQSYPKPSSPKFEYFLCSTQSKQHFQGQTVLYEHKTMQKLLANRIKKEIFNISQ